MSSLNTVKKFYSAIAKGDVNEVLDVLLPDITWTEAEGFPYFSGTWRTPQEVIDKLLVPLARDWDAFTVVPYDFLADGDRVVTFGVYTGIAKNTGKTLFAPFAHLWSVRDDKIASFQMYTDTLLVAKAMS